jgi:hypothetical protein
MKQEIFDDAIPTGRVQIQHFAADGSLKAEHNVKNLVVTTGKNYIASKMVATTNSPVSMTHMGIGTDATTPAAANTALGAQTGRVSLSGANPSNNTITYTATFPAGTGDGAITEAGIFNASSGGVMLCRTTFPVVNKQSGDTIAVTWIVTVS